MGKTPTSNEGPRYEIKQSDGEFPLMMELWGMRVNPSLLSPRGPLWDGVVRPEKVLSMGQVELFGF